MGDVVHGVIGESQCLVDERDEVIADDAVLHVPARSPHAHQAGQP